MRPDVTLDPDDWQEFGDLAHRMVDDIIGHLRTLPEQPAWQAMPDQVRNRITDEPLPLMPQGSSDAYRQFLQDVLPYPNGNLGPRFYGWVQGTGVPLGMMCDMLASGMNPHMAGCNQAPALVEQKVLDWLRDLMGFPDGTTGLLVSGASMANQTAMTVARNVKAGFDVRLEGLSGGPRLTIYGSTETHSWAKKTANMLGLGERSFRTIPVHDDYTIDLSALREAIDRDRREGCRPFAVLGSAGTVNTGATDDLNALADLCASEDLWFHVDGAFGALAAISPRLKPIVAGMERADSLGFDLHKWMCLPFEIACVLVRDGEKHRATFSHQASYLATLERGTIAGGLPFAERGLELTRGFKALKAWICLKAFGVERFAALVEQNVNQAIQFKGLVDAHPQLERLADVPLNIVCFRFVDPRAADLDALNTEILLRIQERGLAVPSSTVLNGKFCLRACFVNHRTTSADVDAFARDVVEIGNEILGAS